VTVKLYNMMGNVVFIDKIIFPLGLSINRLKPPKTSNSTYILFVNDNENTIVYSKIIYL
jgi:hypothetical protein